MRRLFRMSLYIFLLGMLTLHVHTGCESAKGKGLQHYLCSVNSDGSNFQRIYYNDNENTEPGCSNGLYKNYLFRVYCGTNKLLLVFENNYRVINPDGSGLRELTSFIQHDRASVAYTTDPAQAYFNYSTTLYRVNLDSGVNAIASNVFNSISYPLGNLNNGIIYMGSQDNRINSYDTVTHQVASQQTNFLLDKAYYVESLGKYLCLDSNQHITLVSADGTDADTLLSYTWSYLSPSEVMLPVGDGTRYLAAGYRLNNTNYGLTLHNVSNASFRELGPIYYHSHYFMDPDDGTHYAIDVCRNGRYIFWCDTYAIYKYDLQTSTREVVMVSGEDNFAAQKFESISSNADGSKLYFVCELYDHMPGR